MQSNVLGGQLAPCCLHPRTGYYRDGHCRTGSGDRGLHTVCAVMSTEFLAFSKAQGNDLSTPQPDLDFPGLVPGDRWCLCVTRWQEALRSGAAPQILLAATHISTLEFVELADLKRHAADLPAGE